MTVFRYNPYDVVFAKVFIGGATCADEAMCHAVNDEAIPAFVEEVCSTPTMVMHNGLCGQLAYFAYPTHGHFEEPMPAAKGEMTRLFVGQVPVNVTKQQVEWIVELLSGCRVFGTEIIRKWTGDRQPKGCVHTYCFESDAERIIEVLHQRVLIDDCGIWFAEDRKQKNSLKQYCTKLKRDKSLRVVDRPHQPMVVEIADSTFVPRPQLPTYESHMMCPFY